jgi:hypothetical protein
VTTQTLSKGHYKDKLTGEPFPVVIVDGREIPLTAEVIKAVEDSRARRPVNADSTYTNTVTGKKVRTATVLGKQIPITKALVLAVMNRTIVSTCPVVRAGRLLDGALLSIFAELRAAGCDVKWAQREKGLLATTYYNLRVEGPAVWVESFENWIENPTNR